LIVAGVLAYYGIFAPAGFLGPTARGFGQVQVLNPWSIVGSDGTTTLYLENRVGGSITVDSLTINPDGTGAITCTPAAAVAIDSGAKATMQCTPASGWTAKTAGQTYSATIIISYTFQSNTFTTTGTISGTYS